MVKSFLQKLWDGLKKRLDAMHRCYQLRCCLKGKHQSVWVTEFRPRIKTSTSVLNKKGGKRKTHVSWVSGGYYECRVCGKKLSNYRRTW